MNRTQTLLAATCLLAFTAGHAAAADKHLEGVWRSQGYGMVLAVDRAGAKVYDVTANTCLPQSAELGFAKPLLERAVLSADGKHFTSRAPYGLTTLYFDKVAAVSAACTSETRAKTDPRYNFDVFWETAQAEYAFFDQRAVDWKALGETYRAQITEKTTDEELVAIIQALFRQLQDRHVTLFTGQRMLNAQFPAVFDRWMASYDGSVPLGKFQGDKIAENLTPSWNRYLDAGSVKRVSDMVTTGTAASGQVGYILISGESGYAASGEEDVDADVAGALAQWDKAFEGVAGKRGLILDMRINSGGNDEAGLGLAGLLTATDRPGFTKCTRNSAGFTPTQHTTIKARREAFTGPVVILISDLNWSAGENFAMMARDFPNVVLVGDHTASVHSDTLVKFLPNGWRFSISNEAIVAPDGRLYESVGVPPDVLVPVDIDAIKADGVDPQMEKALHLLNSGRFEAMAAAAKRRPSAIGRPSPCQR
jgi:carboxyl-terminal processing protease